MPAFQEIVANVAKVALAYGTTEAVAAAKYPGSDKSVTGVMLLPSLNLVICPFVALLALLNTLSLDGSIGHDDSGESLLSSVSRTVTPLFAPMGIEPDNWPATVGIFTGVFAKEAVVGTLNQHDFVYLRRGDMRQECNIMTGLYAGCHVKLFDYSHTAAPDYYAEHRHTLIILRPQGGQVELPDMVVTPGHYLQRYLVEYEEIDNPALTAVSREHRWYLSHNGPDYTPFIERIHALIRNYPGIYLEIRDNALLLFRPDRELESTSDIEALLRIADLFCTIGSGTAD